MSILSVVAVIGIVGYVIARQLFGEPLRGKRLILLPLILAIIGGIDLGKNGRHLGPADIVLIVIEVLVATVIGLGQGSMMQLEARDGVLWGKMPRRSLWVWAALLASHGVLDLSVQPLRIQLPVVCDAGQRSLRRSTVRRDANCASYDR